MGLHLLKVDHVQEDKKLKKKGTLDQSDFDDVKFKNKIDMKNHKPIVKKKW